MCFYSNSACEWEPLDNSFCNKPLHDAVYIYDSRRVSKIDIQVKQQISSLMRPSVSTLSLHIVDVESSD